MSHEAEQSIIGSMMIIGDPNSDVIQKILTRVKESSFSLRQHKMIFAAMKTLALKGNPIDPLTVDAKLIELGQSEETGGYAYVTELAVKTPSAANVMAYVEILRESAIQRVANTKLQEALATLNDNDGRTVYEKIGLIESSLSVIMDRGLKNKETGLRHIRDFGDKWSQELNNRFENPTMIQGYSTGIESVDKILYPKMIRKGSLVVIGARPKMGKTALLNNIVGHFALQHKKAAAFFSLEMPGDHILERMLVERASVNPDILYNGAEDQADLARVTAALGEYLDSDLYIDDTPGISLQHVQREARKLAKQKDIGMIALDYLTLMEAEKADRNDLAYGKITKALKNLAKELDCIVVLLTQLNRSLETRTNKRPMPSDSRDTGQIEQDCDLWLGLYREGVYKDLAPEQAGLTEVLVRLNRHGNTGTGYLNLKNGYFVEADPFSFGSTTADDEY